MGTIKVSAPVPERVVIIEDDKEGDTWVMVKPPSWQDETVRGRLLTKRRMYRDPSSGRVVHEVEVNLRELYEMEVWLTYAGTNMVVELEQPDKSIKTITFADDEDFQGFMTKLQQLPPDLIYRWRVAVLEKVPGWNDPF